MLTLLLTSALALDAHPPVTALPPAAPRGVQRDVSLTLGVGGGWLALNDNIGRDGQGALTLRARAAAGVGVNWMLFLGVEVGTTNRGPSWFTQTTAMAGVQRFLSGRFYGYGGLGPSWVTESSEEEPQSNSIGPGWGVTFGVGAEALRFPHCALAIEASASVGLFAHERWDTGGLNLALSWY